MPPDRARLPGGYLAGLLASGAMPFAPRTRVHRLLGVPSAEGGGASFLPPLPPVGFQYAQPGPGGPGFGPTGHGPAAPLADPSFFAAPPARPAAARDAWDGWDDAPRPAAAPRMAVPRAEPAPRPAAIDPPAPARNPGATEEDRPASPAPVTGSPASADARPALRSGPARAAKGETAAGKTVDEKAADAGMAGMAEPHPATSSTKSAPADAAPVHRPEGGAAEGERETKPVPPARTVGLTIPGISGPREILAALAQREASREASREKPDLRRPRPASTKPAAPAGEQETETDAAPSAARPASAAPRPPVRREPRAGVARAAEADESGERHHPLTRSPAHPVTRSPVHPLTPAQPRLRAASPTGEAGIEQLRRAMATRARQSAPAPQEPPPAPPAPAPVIVQAAPQPVIVVQAPGGLEATAPQAFLSSSLLRGSHLRVLR